MFDFLKKKIGGFIDGLTGREAAKEEPQVPAPKPPEPERAAPKPETGPAAAPKAAEAGKPAKARQPAKPEAPEPARARKPGIPKPAEAPKPPEPKSGQEAGPKRPEAAELPKPETAKPAEQKPGAAAPARPEPETAKPPQPAPPAGEPKPRISLSPISAIKSFITQEVEIGEGDVRELLGNLELELLESDVDMAVAEAMAAELRTRLVGAKVRKAELHPFISSAIRGTLEGMLANERTFTLPERVAAAEKPVKIMFIGVNGSGKTTTIAKVARMLMDDGRKVVFAAADTFRAAAIEQMSVHADRLGVKVIKRDYGSDPTSVAYDAVNYAKAHGMDAVLIDTAGRQDTNISLLNEMKKMSRVIKPDLTIYVGESIAGNAILEQISSFNREIGIDAVILTKMDCDAKGGTMLSISKATGVPIIYVGMGQGYHDLEKFDPAKIAARIVA